MTKDELIQCIKNAIRKLEVLKVCQVRFPTLIELDSLQQVIDWLSLMMDDISAEIMPEFHYQKAVEDISKLKVQNILDTPEEMFPMLNKISEEEDAEYAPSRHIKSAINNVHTYDVFRNIGFAQNNCVVVGPNGCGKTTLANTFTQSFTNNIGTVIPAQKLLIAPTIKGIPWPDEINDRYQKYQKSIKDSKRTYDYQNGDSFPYELTKNYGDELQNVFLQFLADWNKVKTDVFKADRKGEKTSNRTKVDEAIEIWNDLMQERQLGLDDKDHFILSYEGKSYPAHLMSEGEREILYLIGRVLFAPDNGYVIVDEPEIYLHKTIVNKLWDKLEQKRTDCKFVYLTHDLDFAATRQAQKCWIKRFHYPTYWEIQPLSDSEIPEELLLSILGSRKKILFCEGTRGSKDIKIFEVLFPECTITPVASCSDVINYTKAFNRVHNRLVDAYGIVDRDFRPDGEIAKLKQNNVYAYDVAEVENLFLVEEIITAYSTFSHLPIDIAKIKGDVISELDREKELQASSYVTARLNYEFGKNPIDNEKTLNAVKKRFHDFVSEIQIEEWYNERIQELETIIKSSDYSKVIKLFNHKGLHQKVASAFGLKNYQERVFEFVKANEDARNILITQFPEEIRELAKI